MVIGELIFGTFENFGTWTVKSGWCGVVTICWIKNLIEDGKIIVFEVKKVNFALYFWIDHFNSNIRVFLLILSWMKKKNDNLRAMN